MAHKRSIYLINPKFQVRFSIMVCALVVIPSLIYPFTINEFIASLIEKVSDPNLKGSLAEQKKNLMIFFGLWQLGFTGIIFIVCIFFSHKIAGPLYKLKKFLTGIREGSFYGTLYFRNGDYFQELAEEFNETFEIIQENYKQDFVYLSEVNAYINNLSLVVPDDKKIVLKEISNKLSEIQNRFNEN